MPTVFVNYIIAFRKAIVECRYFVFTLGLTESWFNKAGGYEYPMCPGTAAGAFDEGAHTFVNQDYYFVCNNLKWVLDRLFNVNSDIRVILTVSPVPLTATRSGNHVVVATVGSKSVLRAAAGHFQGRKRVDYFPSYELVASTPFRGSLFESNMRNVSAFGVQHVMNTFFSSVWKKYGRPSRKQASPGRIQAGDGRMSRVERAERFKEVCEEQLLEAFGVPA